MPNKLNLIVVIGNAKPFLFICHCIKFNPNKTRYNVTRDDYKKRVINHELFITKMIIKKS